MSPMSKKVNFNSKTQLKILLSHNIHLHHGLLDPKIAAWVIDSESNKVEENPMSINYAQDKELEQLYQEAMGEKRPLPNPTDPYDKSFVRVHRSLLLMKQYEEKLSKEGKEKEYAIFNNLEMRITPILGTSFLPDASKLVSKLRWSSMVSDFDTKPFIPRFSGFKGS